MPIHTGQDKNGKFYQWGKTGKKYYFKPEDKQSKQRALNKAKKQQTAIYSSGWKGDTMKLMKVRVRDKDLSAWMKAGFPAGFQLTFERKPEGASVKEKVVVQGRLSERSTELYIEYKESTNSRHWTFDSISYRKIYNEWSYGRGAERRDSFSGSPKNALTKILQWQVVQNDWNDEVSNIKISFS